PVMLLKVVGTYVIAGLIFASAIFGLIIGVKKKLGSTIFSQSQRKSTQNSRPQQLPNNSEFNPVKMGFATNINELRNNQTETTSFQGRNFYDNLNQNNVNQQPQPQPQTQAQSAYDLLYPQNAAKHENLQNDVQPDKEENFDEYDNLKGLKRNSKLVVFNVGKNNNLAQKTKREIHVEEKEKKRAQDILFNVSDNETDFKIDNSNRPQNLFNDRKTFDKRVDTIRDDSTFIGTFNNNLSNEKKVNFPSFEDAHTNIDFVNKPTISPKEENSYDFKASKDEQTQRRKDLFTDSKTQTNIEQNVEPKNTQIKEPTSETKKDNVADMFKIEVPKQSPKILSSSTFVKKEDVESINEKAKADAKENQRKVDEQALIDEEKKAKSQFYTKEDYANNTREIKDLFASGKIKDRVIEIPDSNVSFEKKMPPNGSNYKIITSVNEISSEKSKKKEEFNSLSKAILNAPVDEAFNQIELNQDDNLDELMQAEGVLDDGQSVSPVYSLDDFDKTTAKPSTETQKTQSV
ncbi:MAG: hypothetical protein RR327_07260, partial [Clostridia bacterium]